MKIKMFARAAAQKKVVAAPDKQDQMGGGGAAPRPDKQAGAWRRQPTPFRLTHVRLHLCLTYYLITTNRTVPVRMEYRQVYSARVFRLRRLRVTLIA